MGAESDHVLVQLSIDSAGLARAEFGEIGILSHKAAWAERIRRYKSTAAALVDWGSTTPEYRAIAAAIAQNPGRSVAILRAAGTVTQRYDVSLVALGLGSTYAIDVAGEGVTDTTVSYTTAANITFVDGDVNTGTDLVTKAAHGLTSGQGPFRLSNSGGALPTGLAVDTNVWIYAPTSGTFGFATSKANALAGTLINITAAAGGGTHSLLRNANDVVIAQLVDQLTAVTGANFTPTQTAGAGDTDSLRVTGSATNNWFSLKINNPALLSIVQSHAAPTDVTLATDLANIKLEDNAWYCLYTLYNSSAYVQAVAAWVTTNDKIYVFDSVDSAIETTAVSGGTDVGAVLLGLNYSRVLGEFYPNPAAMNVVATTAEWLAFAPGKATWKYKTTEGQVGLTQTYLNDTHKTNIRARRMNSYEQVLPDRAFSWEGTVFSTTYKFIDVTRNADWIRDTLAKNILEVFLNNPIVPYTPAGLVLIHGAFERTGEAAEASTVLAPGWTIEMPVFEEISSTDKADRNLRNAKLVGTLAGAIHTAIPVEVILTF